MSNINLVVQSGRLTRDPEWRDVGDAGVCGLAIALNSRTKQGDQWVDAPPQFFDWAVWRGLGGWCRDNLKKGDLVVIRGRAQFRQWEKDGQKRSAVNFVADDIEMGASPKRERVAAGVGAAQDSIENYTQPAQQLGADEDIPF